DTSQVLQQHDATTVAELATMLKIAKHDAKSNVEEEQEELVNDKEVPPEMEG
ncbi:hypothetical protein C0995_008716, partial [Termitomyces sp. Mi166